MEGRAQVKDTAASKNTEKTRDVALAKKEEKAPSGPDKATKEASKAMGAVTSSVSNRPEVLEEHGTKEQQKKLEAAAAKRASST